MRRTALLPGLILVPLALLLAGCVDRPLPTGVAPAAPAFTQAAASPVVNSLDDVVDSQGCDDAHCSLREAIAFAGPGANITFAVTGTIALTNGELLIDKDLGISGPAAASLTITANYRSRVFRIAPGATVNLARLIITGGENGIRNEGALTLTGSTVTGNRTSSDLDGGGVHNSGGALTLVNSTVSGNTSDRGAGGIASFSGRMTLIRSTVSDNDGEVGGLFVWGTPLTLQNSIVADNRGEIDDCDFNTAGTLARITDLGYNIVEDGSCISNQTSRRIDPMLGPLADNGGPTLTHALPARSPAVNAIPFGTNGCGLSTDQRGVSRPQSRDCDIGAFEFRPPSLELEPAGTLVHRSGIATVSGTVTCPDATPLTLDVTIRQLQTRGRNTTAVYGTARLDLSCDGATAWTAELTPTSGRFTADAADVGATLVGTRPLVETSQAVQLR